MEIKIGDRIGKLTVISKEKVHKRAYHYGCKCECGNERSFPHNALARGNNKSCGCLSKSHGMTKTRIYTTWQNIKKRCDDPNSKSYDIYGGRGISYDKRWNKFENFYEDMKECYSDHLTIDRINSNGDYTKENCRWVDRETQANNTRSNRYVQYNGDTLSVANLCKKYGFNYDIVRARLLRGETLENAVKPIERETLNFHGEVKTVTEWAELNGMTYYQLKKRLMRGWTIERAITQPLRKSANS